jgi:hypothetical protein
VSSSPQRLSLTSRVVVAVAVLVLFAVLATGFARLATLAGVGRPDSDPVPSVVVAAGEAAAPTPGVASASGQLAADPMNPASSPASSTTPSPATSPSVPTLPGAAPAATTVPSQAGAALPPRWPQSLPDPGQHTVVSHEAGFANRWVLGMPGGMSLLAGRFLAELGELGWELDTVVTQAGVTAIGVKGDERISVVFREPTGDLPASWSSVEVIYQPRLPEFEVPTTSTTTPEERARKGS